MVKQMFSLGIDQAVDTLERLFKNFEAAASHDQDRFVTVLISKPGVGKSATISKMAKRMGYDLIQLNVSCIEPTDIIGLGAREKVDGRWVTMAAVPQWVERVMAGNCIVFLDEFNNTRQDVLAGFQKMLSDFKLEDNEIPRTSHIIAACNPPGRDAIYAAKKLSGAFRRRLCMLPVVDDFEYVARKHGFTMPRGFLEVDYEDLMNYCDYDDISSAVIDNLFNISKYTNLTSYEQVALVNGFGSKALAFAKELQLLPEDVMASGRSVQLEEVTYQEWKKNPGDQVSEYQQILWGQESLQNSRSYSRSKGFLSRVSNPSVYVALYEVLKECFPVEYELDRTKLPATRNGSKPPAEVGGGAPEATPAAVGGATP